MYDFARPFEPFIGNLQTKEGVRATSPLINGCRNDYIFAKTMPIGFGDEAEEGGATRELVAYVCQVVDS